MKKLSLFFSLICFANSLYSQNPVVTDHRTILTNMGAIIVELYGKDAPKTVENFVGLANQGFYDGILFHRVVKGFVIQAADPHTKDSTLIDKWGTGGESIYGGDFEDELDTATPSYKRGYVEGVLAMANRGPNTNTSQFFIGFGSAKSLPKKYTIFGKVKIGMNVVMNIEKVAVDTKNRPINPVRIISIKEAIIDSVDKTEDKIGILELK